MMEIAAIATTFQGLTKAYESVKEILQQRDEREAQLVLEPLRSKIFEAQEKTLSLHAAYMTMYNKKVELEDRLKEVEQFELDRQDYRLTQVHNGGVVYAFQPTSHADKDAHWLCPRCFEAHKTSILQPMDGRRGGGIPWECSSCNHQLHTSSFPQLPPPTEQ